MDKISFKTWITVFFGGIVQFLGRVFSWKNRSILRRVCLVIVTFSVAAIAIILGCAFYYDSVVREEQYAYSYERTPIGDGNYFYDKGRYSRKSYVVDASGKKVVEHLDWLLVPENGDSLAVFSKGNKRGFLNRYTLKEVVTPQYDAAWIFNDGLAGVAIGDSVMFVDREGKQAFKRKFKRRRGMDYIFHDGRLVYCGERGKYGIADPSGNDVLVAMFDNVQHAGNGLWLVEKDGHSGAVSAEGLSVFPCTFKSLAVYEQGGVVVTLDNGSKQRYDYDGTLLENFVFDEIMTLDYLTSDLDNEGCRIRRDANRVAYVCGDNYGLLDANGKPITPPLYSWIEAIGPSLYECRLAGTAESVILNDKGVNVNE